MYPPTVGPSAGPATSGIAKAPRASPRSPGGNARKSVLIARGNMNPPAKPWRTRAKMSTQNAGAMPQRTDDRVNAASAVTQTRFMVKRASRNEAIGVATPFASAKPVIAHCTVATCTPNTDASFASATFTTVASMRNTVIAGISASRTAYL
jgi:hypothetical protein